MKEQNMAELQFEAPLARFDCEEWNDFIDSESFEDLKNSNVETTARDSSSLKDMDNFSETFSGSLEDLVNTFDDKIKKCFKDYAEKVDKIAPVQIRSQEEIMADCQTWWTLTGNFGNVLPIDWSKTYIRELQHKSLDLTKKEQSSPPNLDMPEDEELQQAFDIHSMIVSNCHHDDDYVETADEVINELHTMMDMSESEVSELESLTPSSEVYSSMYSSASSDLANLKERHNLNTTNNLEDSLKNLSTSALNELYDELDSTIKDYSETLIQELALRDELEFEKEQKNQFISLLLSVHQKRKDLAAEKRKSGSNLAAKSLKADYGTYLTTVIPYHPERGTPPVEVLQIFNKILAAMNDDNSAVPTLLTDYILKVLCPTS